MKDKLYNLIYLDFDLRRIGFSQRCYKYELSSDSACLHITYLDFQLEPQFIVIFRTSRLAYRVYHGGKMLTFRTSKLTLKYLLELITNIIADVDLYKNVTVFDLKSLTLSYTEKLELYRRSNKKNK